MAHTVDFHRRESARDGEDTGIQFRAGFCCSPNPLAMHSVLVGVAQPYLNKHTPDKGGENSPRVGWNILEGMAHSKRQKLEFQPI